MKNSQEEEGEEEEFPLLNMKKTILSGRNVMNMDSEKEKKIQTMDSEYSEGNIFRGKLKWFVFK